MRKFSGTVNRGRFCLTKVRVSRMYIDGRVRIFDSEKNFLHDLRLGRDKIVRTAHFWNLNRNLVFKLS